MLKTTVLALTLLTAGVAVAEEGLRLDLRRGAEKLDAFVTGADDGRISWDREGLATVFDSTLPASRVSLPLGRSLTGADSFALAVELELAAIDGGPDDFMQLAFGLVNAGTTGLNRTGTSVPPPVWFIDDSDTHDQVEFAYFPNETFFGGPFLQPAVFGANVGSPFANFAADFGPGSDLGDNGPDELSELPVGRLLRVLLVHDACAETLTTRIFDAASGEELAFGLNPVDLGFVNATGSFIVDSFAVSLYQDLADFDPSTRSLFADLQLFSVELLVAEAPAAEIKPVALNATARGDATLRIDGGAAAWLGLEAAMLHDAAGVATPLELRSTGRGLSARIPRNLAAEGPLALEIGGCTIPVAGPARTSGP